MFTNELVSLYAFTYQFSSVLQFSPCSVAPRALLNIQYVLCMFTFLCTNEPRMSTDHDSRRNNSHSWSYSKEVHEQVSVIDKQFMLVRRCKETSTTKMNNQFNKHTHNNDLPCVAFSNLFGRAQLS